MSPSPHEDQSQEPREQSDEVDVPVLTSHTLHHCHRLHHCRRGRHLHAAAGCTEKTHTHQLRLIITVTVRLGPNMLQNLPIILFHTAYFSHLLFSCFLPLFSYKIVFKVFLCTFAFRGEADCSRLGPNMLQNLPIILFHTAYFSHLLFSCFLPLVSCFLPLFSYKIVFKVFLCTFVFRGEADCSVSSLIVRWLPEQVSLAGRGVTRLLFARYLDLRLTLNCCCIGHPCPYCTC